MALVIRASSFLVKHYLKVTDWGVDYMETAGIGGRRKFKFGQIDYILLAANQATLSFQVGQEVFSIKTKPGNAKHQLAIKTLIDAVAASQPRVAGFPVVGVAN
jgi:hypothetical protein